MDVLPKLKMLPSLHLGGNKMLLLLLISLDPQEGCSPQPGRTLLPGDQRGDHVVRLGMGCGEVECPQLHCPPLC